MADDKKCIFEEGQVLLFDKPLFWTSFDLVNKVRILIKRTFGLKDLKVMILSGIAQKTFRRSQQALTEFGENPVPEPEVYIEKPVDADVLAAPIKKAIG